LESCGAILFQSLVMVVNNGVFPSGIVWVYMWGVQNLILFSWASFSEKALVFFENRGRGDWRMQEGIQLVFCRVWSSSWMNGWMSWSASLYWILEIRTSVWRLDIVLMLYRWGLKKLLLGSVFSVENLCLSVELIIC